MEDGHAGDLISKSIQHLFDDLVTYSQLLKSCPEVGILQHSMGESFCGKSCLFAERKGTLDFCKILCFLIFSFESSVHMVFYESLNLTGHGIFKAKTSV